MTLLIPDQGPNKHRFRTVKLNVRAAGGHLDTPAGEIGREIITLTFDSVTDGVSDCAFPGVASLMTMTRVDLLAAPKTRPTPQLVSGPLTGA
jgi:hypothetical protein